jgi:hypothetical protein
VEIFTVLKVGVDREQVRLPYLQRGELLLLKLLPLITAVKTSLIGNRQ